MAKTLILPGEELGYIQVKELIIFADNKALLLYSWENVDREEVQGWRYFNPENGRLIGEEDGL